MTMQWWHSVPLFCPLPPTPLMPIIFLFSRVCPSVVQFAGRARIMPHSDRAHCKNGGDDEDNCRWLVAYPFAKLFFFNGVLSRDFYKMCIRIPELYHMA